MGRDSIELVEDFVYRRDSEKAEKELMLHLERISQCSHCPMKFVGTPSEREKASIEHIKKEHLGKKQITIW